MTEHIAPHQGHHHCWHITGEWEDTAGHHRSEQCCHCGEFRQTDIPPRFPNTTTPTNPVWTERNHGPFDRSGPRYEQ